MEENIKMRNNKNLSEFMSEKKSIDRFYISVVFLTGMFCGAILAVLLMWSAVIV